MSWLHDLSHDLISYHIQQYSTKSTNCTYLSPYSWRLIFLIHQTLSIYCWEALHPSSYLLELISPPLFLLPPYNYWAVGYTSLLWIKPPVGTRRTWWPSVRLAERSKYGHCRKLMSWFIVYLRMDLVRWLIRSLWEKSETLGWMTKHFVTIQELLGHNLL